MGKDKWVHDVANLVLVPLSQYSLLLIRSHREPFSVEYSCVHVFGYYTLDDLGKRAIAFL